MMKKKEINHLLVYLVAAVVCVLAVIQSQQNILPQLTGIIAKLLLLLNLALSGVVLLTIAKGTAKTHSVIMVISIAAYTFYKITMAVINMVKVRKMQSPSLITIRNIGVADALVSILTLQTTMLASFQDTSTIDANQMNGITGLAVCILMRVLS